MSKDLYKILGVDRNANDSDIKKAYRTMAKKYHPDKNPDDKEAEQKFKDVAEAYEILSNPENRAKYNSIGYDNYTNRGNGRQYADPSDIFSQMFHSMREEQENGRLKQKYSIFQKVTLTMEEAYNGVTKKFNYSRVMKCEDCDGKGGENVVRCGVCDGQGLQIKIINTELGRMQQTITCNSCDGRGFKIGDECGGCNGKGITTKTEKLELKIPESILPNQQINVPNKGHFYSNRNVDYFGDVIMTVEIKQDDFQIINDYGLISKVDIPYEIMVLGGEFIFNTIDGSKVKVPVSKFSNIGHKLKLKGKGLKKPTLNNVRGDQYIMIDLKFPTEISEAEEKLLNELKKIKE